MSLLLVVLALVWEGAKAFGRRWLHAEYWRYALDLTIFNDTQLPHLGDIRAVHRTGAAQWRAALPDVVQIRAAHAVASCAASSGRADLLRAGDFVRTFHAASARPAAVRDRLADGARILAVAPMVVI
ncbi:MAG: hypothetical protein IPK17_14085 [Chloroflexi bacterium]|uniref:hypothetical protein n=1 Tax=Candidatus Flexifilum breve TaxID=3140694 RepID=UPI0031347602|nr:hypothetical protein [Chloroflexota bacterium]